MTILTLMLVSRCRCEFELTESGDVNWYPAEPGSTLAKSLPLFKCRTFEVLREREGLSVVINLRFGAYRGHILEFRVNIENLRCVNNLYSKNVRTRKAVSSLRLYLQLKH